METLFSFIVPTYNEVDSIGDCLAALRGIASQHGWSHEIIVVDSGSTDGTISWLQNCEGEDLVKIFQPQRLGMGVALKEAYQSASGKYICHFECDMPFDLEKVTEALTLLEEGGVDFVLGQRRGGRHSLVRVLYTAGYHWFIRLFFGGKWDTVNFSFKVFRRSLLSGLNLVSPGWFIDAELVIECFRAGAVIREIPVEYLMRSKGNSTVRFSDVFKIIKEALNYARSRSSSPVRTIPGR